MSVNVGEIRINLTAGTADFEAKFNSVKAQLAAAGISLNTTGKSVDGLTSRLGQLGSHGVSNVQATSASLRLLEGGLTNNLRAAERFLATTAGFGPILQKAFPVVGGLAFIGVLGQMAEHVAKLKAAFDKLREAPQRITEAFRGINDPLRVTNDELRVTNDRLANDIAKLQGKPQNGLKLALDEARLAADKLGESLHKDLEDLQKVFKEKDNNVGWFGKLTGTAGSDDLQDRAKTLEKDIGTITDRGSDRIRAASTETEKHNAQLKMAADLQARYRQELQWTGDELQRVQINENRYTMYSDALKTGDKQMLGVYNQQGWNQIPDQSYRLNTLTGYRRNINEQADFVPLENQKGAQEGQKALLDTALKPEIPLKTDPYSEMVDALKAKVSGVAAELKAALSSVASNPVAAEMAKGFAEASKQVDTLNKRLAETARAELAAQKEAGRITPAQYAAGLKDIQANPPKATLGQIAGLTGPEDQVAAMQALIKTHEELAKRDKDLARDGAELAEGMAKEKSATEAKTRSIQEQIAATVKLMAAQRAELAGGPAPDERGQTAIKIEEIKSKTDWTDPTAAKEATAEIALLELQGKEKMMLEALKLTKNEQLDQIKDQINLLQLADSEIKKYGGDATAVESALLVLEKQRLEVQDKAIDAQGTAMQGMQSFFREMANNTVSAAQEVHDLFKEAFSGFNNEIAKAITGKKPNFAGVFEGLAQNTAKWGLSTLEHKGTTMIKAAGDKDPNSMMGRLSKMLGLDKKDGKPDGTQGNAFYVKVLPQGASGSSQQASGAPTPGGDVNLTSDDLAGLNSVDSDWDNSELAELQNGGAGDSTGIGENFGAGNIFGDGGSQLTGLFQSIFGNISGGGGGGFLSSLLGSLFGGFRAEGGDVDAGDAYVVGEKGPELWTPPEAGGSITPNGKGAGAGGGGNVYYSVDARGANAADVDMRMQRALIAVHGSAVRTSVAMQREARTRLPRNKFLVS
ncbi:MAG: hypothetical protein WB992_14525 [Bryobacteraceae bacterium]